MSRAKGFAAMAGNHWAKGIQSALDPNSLENRTAREAKESYHVEGTSGASWIRVRGRVLEVTAMAGARVMAYGRKCWLKARWVRDLGDGTLFIRHVAFLKNARLRDAQKAFTALVKKKCPPT